MKTLTVKDRRRLAAAARKACRGAYAPYSQFPVGAAVLGDSGAIHAGCNVENASYGLGLCAERAAVAAAVGAGERRIRAVAVYTPTDLPTLPCGACRQVLREFGGDAVVMCVCEGSDSLATSLEALLPASFGPEDLLGAAAGPRDNRDRPARRKRPARAQ